MLERRILGEVPAKPHTLFQQNQVNRHEFVFTRDGFSGGFSILYGANPPTSVKSMARSQKPSQRFLGEALPLEDVINARRHIEGFQTLEGKCLFSSRTAMFHGKGCRISTLRSEGNKPLNTDWAFCNGDGDELYFIYDGAGELHTMFGRLPFKKHDYVLIPRGVAYLWRCSPGQGLEGLCIEGDPFIEIPKDFRNPFGQLKLEAPYTHRDFRSPQDLLTKQEAKAFEHIITLRNNIFTEHQYTESPYETIGWDGSVYPIAFSIHDYLPKTGKIHLPPNLHLTFQGRDFVVCSFVPRMVDYGEGAIPCPYPHANVQCDEILYYVSGNFTSRKGVKERSLTLHPAGIPHGPQPGRYFASANTHAESKYTNELAVMVDTWQPLQLTKACVGLEDKSYQTSWID